MDYLVTFQPSGRRGSIEQGKTLLQAARELGEEIEAPCGAARVCGKCKVKVEKGGHLSPLSGEEEETLTSAEIEEGFRLSCCAMVEGDLLVFVPEESRGAKQVILEAGKEGRAFNLDPAMRLYYVEMKPASLADSRDDLARLREALSAQYGLDPALPIDYPALQSLPGSLREGGWNVTVVVLDNRLICGIRPGRVENLYGLAVDIGTTTIAAYLCDLATGREAARDSMMNPQVRYGEDVLSRISHAVGNGEGPSDGLAEMNRAVIEGVNSLASRTAEAAGIAPEDIFEVVLVFNTAMHHIALNICPASLGRAPFAPVLTESRDFGARDLGITVNPGANVHVLPIIAGFVGADNVSVLIAEEPHRQECMQLVIDIGTNGEIDLGNGESMYCTSCATGPALEGAQIAFGMRAAPGAIQKVRIDPETLEPCYNVIGREEWYPAVAQTGDAVQSGAKGICGSGIIDVVAEMFKAGIIGPSGRFAKGLASTRVRLGESGRPEYVLAWAPETATGKDITVTQGDVRAVQLAKAALYTGARILMKYRGVDRVDGVTLAGAFGSYIDKESAMVIGMFPDCDLGNVRAVGNAAGDGAKMALLDRKKRVEAEEVARQVQFVETATEPGFQEQFAAAMAFPHSVDPFPHIEHILAKIPGFRTPMESH